MKNILKKIIIFSLLIVFTLASVTPFKMVNANKVTPSEGKVITNEVNSKENSAEKPVLKEGVLEKEKLPLKEKAEENKNNVVGSDRANADTSTNKVDLKIARLTEKGIEPLPEEWYTEQEVDSVVDVDVSGNSYKIDNPYIMLKIPKTEKIKDVRFVDSQTGETERGEDENYKYVKYKYSTLTGGTHASYQFFFKIDGHFAKNNDSINVEVVLYDGDGKEITKDTHTYKVKTVDFEVYSSWQNADDMEYTKFEDIANGHTSTVKGLTEKDSDTRTAPNTKQYANIFASVYPKKIEGLNGSYGMEYPKNLKFVFTYPDETEGFICAQNDKTDPRREDRWDWWGSPRPDAKKFKINKNVCEYIVDAPTFDRHLGYLSNDRYATAFTSVALADKVVLNKDLEVKIDIYKNVDENGQNGELIGSRVEKFNFIPAPFSKNGNFSYIKRSYADYDFEDFGYLYSSDYHYLNGDIFKGDKKMNDIGIPIIDKISNSNNGSGRNNKYSGGDVTKVNEIYTKLDSEGTYFKNIKLKVGHNNNGNPNNDKNKEQMIASIDKGTELYGIAKDGSETLIKDNVKHDEVVQIDDTTRKYQELVFKFKEPVVLDNTVIYAYERIWFVDDEMTKFKDLKDKTLRYDNTLAVSTYDEKEQKTIKGDYTGKDDYSYINVISLHPKVNEVIRDPFVKEFEATGLFDYVIGPNMPEIYHDRSTYGNMKEIKNVSIITLIPSGFEYTGKYERRENSVDGRDPSWNDKVKDPIITTVENYKGTGKTAIIAKYGDVPIEKCYPINLKLKATKNVKRGANTFVNYMTYDNNEFLVPYNDTDKNENNYVDELDLDDDGNTKEIFMKKETTVTYVPPLELINNNSVGYEGISDVTKITSDLGYEINHKINLFNNSIKDVDKLSIIDVLPYNEDHSITPNDEGKYVKRGSTFSTYLTSSLEEANPTLKDKLDFFYQLEEQGGDLASVRDGKWVKKDEVADFKKVKSIKAVLKKGQILKSKESIEIILPANLPKDTDLDEKTSKAFNSAAFSVDDINYTEGNKTQIDFKKYLVSGVAYYDLNENGKYDEGDVPLRNIDVTILNKKDGSVAQDFNKKELTVKTDDNGGYKIPIYKRGDYLVKFTKTKHQIFSTKETENEQKGNSIIVNTIKDDVAKTKDFTLSPVKKEEVKNVATTPIYGKIDLEKYSQDEKQGDSKKALSGVEFALENKDGSAVTNFKYEKIENVTTDKDGKTSFLLVPYGDYIIKEVKTNEAYELSNEEYPITVTGEKDGKNSNVITRKIDNKLKKISINIEKDWQDEKGEKITPPTDKVEVELLRDNELVETKELTKEKDFKLTVDNLQKTDSTTGKDYTYTVREKGIDDKNEIKINDIWYKSISSGEQETGLKITNKKVALWTEMVPAKIRYEVEKDWQGISKKAVENEKILVKLYKNGDPTNETKELTKENDFKATFEDLNDTDFKKDNQKNIYSVKEIDKQGNAIEDNSKIKIADKEYKVTYQKGKITNTLINEKIKVTAQKQWQDEENRDGIRPEKIKVKLLANGEPTGKEILVTKDMEKAFEFDNLDTYDNDGEKIKYTVEEEVPAGYKSEVTGTQKEGFKITNTHEVEKVNIAVEKQWNDAENQDGIRPEKIKVKLLANGKETDQEITLEKDKEYKAEFKNLNAKEKGQEIEYTIKEEVPAGYKSEVTGTQKEGFKITNTHEVEKINIAVEKQWKDIDKQKGKKPEKIKVKLLANGKETGQEITLEKDKEYKAEFKNLNAKEKGQEIEYTIKEEVPAGYKSEVTGTQKDGFKIINTYSPEKVSISTKFKKIIEGEPTQKDKFKFKFTPVEKSNPMPEKEKSGQKIIDIEGAGEKELGKIEFKYPGVYSYKLEEINENNKEIEYDKSIYTITYNVTDKNGKLKVETNLKKDKEEVKEIIFRNKYKQKNQVPNNENENKKPVGNEKEENKKGENKEELKSKNEKNKEQKGILTKTGVENTINTALISTLIALGLLIRKKYK